MLFVALAVADGLVDHEAALGRLAVPDVLRAAFLVEDRVALPHVLRARLRLVVALALLALGLLHPLRHVHGHRGAVLKQNWESQFWPKIKTATFCYIVLIRISLRNAIIGKIIRSLPDPNQHVHLHPACAIFSSKSIVAALALRDIEAKKLQTEPHHGHKEGSNFFNQEIVQSSAKIRFLDRVIPPLAVAVSSRNL